MKKFFSKPYRWAILFSFLLTGATTFVLLDTFVITKTYKAVVTKAATQTEGNEQQKSSGQTDSASQAGSTEQTDTAAQTQSEAVVSDNSYQDANIKISIDTVRKYDSNIYIADIQLTDASYLKTALAGNTYGRNIKDTTSNMAEDNNAIFAINGDFYGFRDYGYVLRNGVLYRDTAGDSQALVMNNTGDFSIIQEDQVSLDSLDTSSLWQVLSFGPGLINEGNILVDQNSEVAQAMRSNPRTAIGEISPLHYIVVVSDGRTSESAGLSLYELAQVFADKGCTTAYNLDGGGSATMYFNGKVVNNPTDGRKSGEREVSDIVYIGY